MSGRLVNPWTPGTTYPPNSVVRPTSVTGSSSSPPTNAGFETGDFTGWTAATGYNVVTTSPYLGTYCASLAAMAGSGLDLINQNQVAIVAGQIITATCYINAGSAPSGATGGCALAVYDSGHSHIATYVGPLVTAIGTTGWVKATITQPMLIGAAFVAVGARCSNTSASDMFVDNFSWDLLVNPYDSPELFYAVQTGTGKSGPTEPTWATTPPNINDGTVTWSSQAPTSILWQTEPLMKSGSLEPGTFGGPPPWPTVPGQSVHDTLSTPPSGMDWLAVTPQVVDPNDPTLPPQSKYVVAAASKLFVLDGDICNYCATTNPLDWTSEADAGFLPIGLQSYGTNPFLAAGLYRSNLVFFNSQGLQMWQVDEDPANMALLDAIPVGCTQHRSLSSINNDLFFLAGQGVRTMGISAGSGNLQAGDVGMPIDPLVQAAELWATTNNVTPIGSYFPSLGQYFLAFPNWPADGLFWSSGGSGTAAGTNTYTATIAGVTSYRAGQFFYITFTNAATGASTLNINGIGAVTLTDRTHVTAGSSWFVQYDGTQFLIMGGITRVFVYTMTAIGQVGAWSHYLLQFTLEDFCQAGNDLCLRGTVFGSPQMFKFDPTNLRDTVTGAEVATYAVVQWPWLDDGNPGQTKQLSGFDMAVTLSAGSYTVEFGYDESNTAAFTTPYSLTTDTVPGMMYPIQVKAPSFSFRFVSESTSGWSIQMANLYLTDKRLTS